MALACPRCGTQNPDGNAFCQACGTPLAAVAPAAVAGPPPDLPPPLVGPLPNVAPPSYQSPYYAPSPGSAQPPVHRAPGVMIIAAVVGLVVVMAGCGTALAVFNSRNANQTTSTGLGTGVPSPTPVGSPSPITSPSPTPAGGNRVANQTLSVVLPPGWQLNSKDSEYVSLYDPNGYPMTIGSGVSSPTQTAQQNKATVDQVFTQKYPDTKACPNSKVTAGSVSGAPGLFWQLCFTLTSGSQSEPVGAPMFAGANADGSVYYVVFLLSPLASMTSFSAEAKPVLASIQWSLK